MLHRVTLCCTANGEIEGRLRDARSRTQCARFGGIRTRRLAWMELQAHDDALCASGAIRLPVLAHQTLQIAVISDGGRRTYEIFRAAPAQDVRASIAGRGRVIRAKDRRIEQASHGPLAGRNSGGRANTA